MIVSSIDECPQQDAMHFDAHQKPSEDLRKAFKLYQRCGAETMHGDDHVVDFEQGLSQSQAGWFSTSSFHPRAKLDAMFSKYSDEYRGSESITSSAANGAAHALLCKLCPGLIILPRLLPLEVQKAMLNRLFHRDLSDAEHKTNVHFHHNLTYPPLNESFFSYGPNVADVVRSKDSQNHHPMSVGTFLNRKLRWVTLGGQYDWTAKVYPSAQPPRFPEDHRALLHELFPATEPEAAIVNVYTPGDTLSLHRDVSESCGNGLISLSIGCDALFMISTASDVPDAGQPEYLVFRVRSGDILYMSGLSRFAFHGVPQVIKDTCPSELQQWPCEGQSPGNAAYSPWSGWLRAKRVNLNVRQMFQCR